MTEAEMSFEERNHLYMLCIVSFLVVSFAFLACMLYLKQSGSLRTSWDFFVRAGLPYSIIEPTVSFLTYEVFYPKRVRRSRMFHVKRFARRALSGFAVILSFAAVTFISEVSFSKSLGSNAFYPGIVLCVLVFLAAVFLWLRRQNSREESNL